MSKRKGKGAAAPKVEANHGMISDDRPIGILELFDGSAVTLGDSGVALIEAYGEPGLHCDMPWLRVINTDGEVMARIPATMAIITYVDQKATMADHEGERPN